MPGDRTYWTDEEVEQKRRERRERRREEYERLEAHDTANDNGRFLAQCPGGCGRWLYLGEGWRGLSIPECPDCNGSGGDQWADDADPVVSAFEAVALMADDRNLEGLLP